MRNIEGKKVDNEDSQFQRYLRLVPAQNNLKCPKILQLSIKQAWRCFPKFDHNSNNVRNIINEELKWSLNSINLEWI